mmetsp:Transcript_41307/g.67952  ORF Transcript_41307/g.67952 Transcript_41307/m.67952 type:complete len:296 (+) Transcript_41307:596-1483(+)
MSALELVLLLSLLCAIHCARLSRHHLNHALWIGPLYHRHIAHLLTKRQQIVKVNEDLVIVHALCSTRRLFFRRWFRLLALFRRLRQVIDEKDEIIVVRMTLNRCQRSLEHGKINLTLVQHKLVHDLSNLVVLRYNRRRTIHRRQTHATRTYALHRLIKLIEFRLVHFNLSHIKLLLLLLLLLFVLVICPLFRIHRHLLAQLRQRVCRLCCSCLSQSSQKTVIIDAFIDKRECDQEKRFCAFAQIDFVRLANRQKCVIFNIAKIVLIVCLQCSLQIVDAIFLRLGQLNKQCAVFFD